VRLKPRVSLCTDERQRFPLVQLVQKLRRRVQVGVRRRQLRGLARSWMWLRMTRTKSPRGACLGVCLCSTFVFLASAKQPFAQVAGEFDTRVTETIREFDAADWQTRVRAFYHLFAIGLPGGLQGRTTRIPAALDAIFKQDAGRKEQVSIALIRLLEKEYGVTQGPTNPRNETFNDDYLGDLVAAVATLHDKRSLDTLLHFLDTGDIATRGLAGLGRDALDPVLRIVNAADVGDPDETTRRMAAARVLSEMLDPNIVEIDELSRPRIKSGLLHASRDKGRWVRFVAIQGLARIPGPDVTATLRSIMESDPFSQSDRSGHIVYPVRDAARAALSTRAGPASK
jgi:hypothetical protein